MRYLQIARYWCALQWYELAYKYAHWHEHGARLDFWTCPAADYRDTWFYWQQARRRYFFARSCARAKYWAALGRGLGAA